MLNIIEKYSAETAAESEEGAIAIEYVLIAAGAAALAVALLGPLREALMTRVQDIIGIIGGGDD